MVEKESSKRTPVSFNSWVRLVSGLMILISMLYYDIHLEKSVEIFLYGFPAYLLGMDLGKIIKIK